MSETPIISEAPESTEVPVETPAPAPTSWRESLPTDLRNHPAIEQTKDVGDLAKQWVNVQSLIGGEKMPAPPAESEKWTDDQWNMHYTRLGRPESSDAYEVNREGIPEDMNWNGDLETGMLAKMHEVGLSQRQAGELFEAFKAGQLAEYSGLADRMEQAYGNATCELQKDWGTAYDSKIDLAKRAFAAAAGGQSDSLRLLRLSDGTELGNHPDFIRMMAGLGEKISEDGLTGEKTPARFTMTPEEATREIASFRYENREAIQSANHPEHQESVARLGQLYAMAYPEE